MEIEKGEEEGDGILRARFTRTTTRSCHILITYERIASAV